eukprot:SAG11_NODE_117_length_15962_cov_71.527925_8_plen_79_part_00
MRSCCREAKQKRMKLTYRLGFLSRLADSAYSVAEDPPLYSFVVRAEYRTPNPRVSEILVSEVPLFELRRETLTAVRVY